MANLARIDLDAIRHNLDAVRAAAPAAQVLAVVKADAYGHGMVPVARTAREHGVQWLGVATLAEARALREAGDSGRLLAWLWAPGDPDLDACLALDVDISVSSIDSLHEVLARAGHLGIRPRLHLKIDTGLARNGAAPQDWPLLVAEARAAEQRGAADVVGVWSHLANADQPGHASVDAQQRQFDAALAVADDAGLVLEVRHLANSPAAFAHPGTHHDLVRTGIAIYGVTPLATARAEDLGLRAAMTFTGTLALVKTIPAGTSVSYGSTWTAPAHTRVGLLPLGYADGLPRIAGNRASVLVRGVRCPVVGRIAMDQCIVVLDDVHGQVRAGEEAIVFGDASTGAPTADDWGDWSETIGYEIVTRLGQRVPRAYSGER